MHTYIVDIADLMNGRTIEVEAHSAEEAYYNVFSSFEEEKFEKVEQIRDSDNLFYFIRSYDYNGLFPIFHEEGM